MYKTRIKKWGFDKNNTAHRVAHMLHLKKTRAAAGKKRTSFAIHGNVVNWDDVEHYLERRPDLVAKLSGNFVEVGGAAAGGVVCRTPSPGPASIMSMKSAISPGRPPLLDTDPETRARDEVLRLYRAYMDGALDQGLWVYDPASKQYHGPSGPRGASRICAWMSDVWSAIDTGSSQAEAVAVINSLMDHLHWMVREQDSPLLPLLLRSYYHIHSWDPAVAATLGPFLAGMSGAVLGPQHPFTLAWTRIIALRVEGLEAVMESVGLLRIEYFESVDRARGRGRNSSVCMIMLEEHFMGLSMRWRGNAKEIDRALKWTMDRFRDYYSYPTEPEPGSMSNSESIENNLAGTHCRFLLRLSTSQALHGHFAEAERMLGTVAKWIERGHVGDVYYMIVNASYRVTLALLYFEMDRDLEAAWLLDKAINVCTRYFPRTRDLAGHVVHWTTSCGAARNPERAAKWRSMVERAAAPHNDDGHREKSTRDARFWQGYYAGKLPEGCLMNHELLSHLGNPIASDAGNLDVELGV